MARPAKTRQPRVAQLRLVLVDHAGNVTRSAWVPVPNEAAELLQLRGDRLLVAVQRSLNLLLTSGDPGEEAHLTDAQPGD